MWHNISMSRATYHHGDLRRAIIDACIVLLEEGGLEKVKMAEAARRAGVSSGAPYKHFKDRQSLLEAVVAEASRRLNSQLDHAHQRARAKGADAQECFRQVGIEVVVWAATHPALFRLMSSPEFIPELELESDSDDPNQAFWRSFIGAIQQGPIAPDGPLARAFRGRTLVHGLAMLFASGSLPHLGIAPDRARELAELVTGG